MGTRGHKDAHQDAAIGIAHVVAGGCSPTTSDFMLMLAMKSAGPKMMVSTRGLAVAILSTLIRPRAFSI